METDCTKVRGPSLSFWLYSSQTHYEPIIRSWTDPSLGYCSYLNLCYGDPMFRQNPSLGPSSAPRGGTKECRYLHFQVAPSRPQRGLEATVPVLPDSVKQRLFHDTAQTNDQERAGRVGQWVNCDLRTFDYSVLGQ